MEFVWGPAERLCLFNLLNQNPSAPDKSAHNVIISFLWEIPAGIGTNDQERKQDSNLEHEHKNRAVKKIILIKQQKNYHQFCNPRHLFEIVDDRDVVA